MKKRQGEIFEFAGRSMTFAEAFPGVATIAVKILELGNDTVGMGQRKFHTLSIREVVNCSNTNCSGKGLSLGNILRRMNARRATHLERVGSKEIR